MGYYYISYIALETVDRLPKSASICQEKELLLQVSTGNETSFAEIFNRYSNKLYSYIISLSGSGQLAEDVVQDVFLKIWQKRSELNAIDHFNSYLFRMAHNHVINIMKKMARETLILSEMAYQFTIVKSETVLEVECRDVRDLYKKAVEKLPPKQKLVFTLSREEGLKQQEIAEQLNISVATVKAHMTQALRFLRNQSDGAYPLIIISFLVSLARLL